MYTVAQMIDTYLAYRAALVAADQLSPRTLALDRTQLKKVRTAAGAYKAHDLRAWHLAGVTLSNHLVRAIKAVFEWASGEDVGIVERNRFSKLPTPPTGRRERVLDRAELARLIRAVPRHYRRYLWLAVQTTMRPGELRGLAWEQIDLPNRSVVLTSFKAKKKRRDGLQRRHVPLTEPACRYLARRRRREAPAGPLFRDRRGRPLTANGVRCVFRRARAAAGLDGAAGAEKVVCYTLRHTSATQRVRDGLPVNVLAVVMGHTNTQMTQRYTHLKPADLVAALDRAKGR